VEKTNHIAERTSAAKTEALMSLLEEVSRLLNEHCKAILTPDFWLLTPVYKYA
jgi:hypothetical protein